MLTCCSIVGAVKRARRVFIKLILGWLVVIVENGYVIFTTV